MQCYFSYVMIFAPIYNARCANCYFFDEMFMSITIDLLKKCFILNLSESLSPNLTPMAI